MPAFGAAPEPSESMGRPAPGVHTSTPAFVEIRCSLPGSAILAVSRGGSKSVQVVFDGIEAAMVLTVMVLK